MNVWAHKRIRRASHRILELSICWIMADQFFSRAARPVHPGWRGAGMIFQIGKTSLAP